VGENRAFDRADKPKALSGVRIPVTLTKGRALRGSRTVAQYQFPTHAPHGDMVSNYRVAASA